MSAPDLTHLAAPDVARRVGAAVRNGALALLGLLVGAIAGLVIAGFAGWLPTLNLC